MKTWIEIAEQSEPKRKSADLPGQQAQSAEPTEASEDVAKLKQQRSRQTELPDQLKADWMTTSEAAEALKKHRCTISKMISRGELVRHPETYHREALVSRASVQKFLDRFKPKLIAPSARKKRRR